MNYSLNTLSSAIVNVVLQGLKAPNSMVVNREQIKDEIYQLRNRMMGELRRQGGFDPMNCYHVIDHLTLAKNDLAAGVLGLANKNILWAKIPSLFITAGIPPVIYAGSAIKRTAYKVEVGEYSFPEHSLMTNKAPTVWIDTDWNLWVINCPTGMRDKMRLVALFNQPRELRDPPDMASAIRTKLVEDYVRHYRSVPPQPNTGADIPQVKAS